MNVKLLWRQKAGYNHKIIRITSIQITTKKFLTVSNVPTEAKGKVVGEYSALPSAENEGTTIEWSRYLQIVPTAEIFRSLSQLFVVTNERQCLFTVLSAK